MLKLCIEKLIRAESLTEEESRQAIIEVLETHNVPQSAAFMVLLQAKGATAAEVTGIIAAMHEKMTVVATPFPVLDIVGTGGDGANTVNISTGAALLTASCGVKVAKHGNRSVSSQCGSADVLEALGVNINLTAEQVSNSIEHNNFGFCYAPNFHPAMSKVKKIRKQLGVPTLFNLLGPLLNPARAEYLMIGVATVEQMKLMADILQYAPIKRAMIFHGSGLDEISCLGPVDIIEIMDGKKQSYTMHPKNYGFETSKLEDLRGGDSSTNASLLREAIDGKNPAIVDTLVLNAATALYIYGSVESISEGINQAKQSIDQGRPLALLDKLKGASHE